jgi:phage-related protein
MIAQSPAWTVEFYVDAGGRSPVQEFIEGLSKQEQVTVGHVFQLLQEYGVNLGSPYVRHVEDKIWELRPGSNRLLYFAHTGRRFIILHAFRKKSQKTPRKESRAAKRHLAEFLEREG